MRIALLQCEPPVGPASINTLTQRLQDLRTVARQARAQGAHCLVTPELYLSGYEIGPVATRELAVSNHGEVIREACTIAADEQIAIALGYAEQSASNDSVFNSATLIDNAGTQLLNYRKVQLFGDTDRSRFTAGDSLSGVATLCGVQVALAICYDIEFPEQVRALAMNGAQLILVPTANMAPFDSVAQRLVPARAEENGIFIAYANYSGTEGQFVYTGLSCLCGPNGLDQARAARSSVLLAADVDLDLLATVRSQVNYLTDRRGDLYDA